MLRRIYMLDFPRDRRNDFSPFGDKSDAFAGYLFCKYGIRYFLKRNHSTMDGRTEQHLAQFFTHNFNNFFANQFGKSSENNLYVSATERDDSSRTQMFQR